MQMEADKSEDRRYPSATCKEKCKEENHDSEKQGMQVMVILGKPQQRMSSMPGQKFRNDSQPVHIRDHCGQRDHDAFALAGANHTAEYPASEEMGDRTHGGSLTSGSPLLEWQWERGSNGTWRYCFGECSD